MQIANFTTRLIHINNGSSVYILFWEAFVLMGIDAARLLPAPMPLKGFSGEMVQPVGTIALSILVGNPPHAASIMVDFLIVRAFSSYNAIIGQPTLNKLKAIAFTYHLKVKFPTAQVMGKLRGEQTSARECYAQELKPTAGGTTPSVSRRLS
ncbi:hypothetical protein I3842_01G113900 [Carya illinoinensis]|uniref:Uncharacterized protein n=1 Tax=Carya illinoinensis TaxID=32201 RepID=A0A922FZ60_CARIL|nr:hypothetical protein I3842_01G113900 [Carya illinoinensis]